VDNVAEMRQRVSILLASKHKFFHRVGPGLYRLKS
jgi:hypothetical protein